MRRSFLAAQPCAVLVTLLILVLSLAGNHSASAAPTGQTFGGDPLNPFPALFPELADLSAPAWLKEGVRASYYGQSATLGTDGSGGAGYIQHDVVATEADLVVVSSALYLDTGDGQVLPSLVYGAAYDPGYGDWWLNPEVLVDAERLANDDLAIVRMPTTIAGEEYQAVRFEYSSGDSVSVWMFEVETGILLYSRLTVGSIGDDRHSSTEMYFVGMRKLKLPWQAKRAPSWVKRGSEFEYGGARNLTVAGTPSIQLPETAYVAVETARPRWSRYTLTDDLNGQSQGTSTRVAGVAQLTNALWLPAEALKANVRRPLIDTDPVTGIETYYTRDGGDVLIEERGPLHYFASTFDGRTGKLLQSHLETQIGVGLNVTDLALQ